MTATGAPEAAARRILIVDDSAIVRHTVAHMLRRLGFVPIEAADGEQALVKIRRSPPDAVILDIHMPVKDGLTTLAELRAAPRFAYLPVFILTTSAGGDHVRRAASLRVSGYLVKAELNYRELGRRIGAVLDDIAAPPATSSEDLLDGLDVLLAHGEEGHARELVAMLADWGCRIIPSDNAAEIAELLRGSSVDVLLVDEALIDKEGFDIAATLASLDGGDQVRVILLTPSPIEEASQRNERIDRRQRR